MEYTNRLLSIVVPARNEAAEDRLPRFLGELMREDLSRAEIVVVDDASDDDTYNVAREACDKLDFRHVPSFVISSHKRGYCGGARNVGLGRALGEYVWMVDADCHLVPGAVSAVYDALSLCPAMALCGINDWIPDCVESFTPSASAKIIRRELVERFRADWGFEDVDWWIRQADACMLSPRGISLLKKTIVRFPDERMSESINRFVSEDMKIWSVLKGRHAGEPVDPRTPASFLRVAAELVDMKMKGEVRTPAARRMLDFYLERHLYHVRRMFYGRP